MSKYVVLKFSGKSEKMNLEDRQFSNGKEQISEKFFFKIQEKELTTSEYDTNLEFHYGTGIKFYKYQMSGDKQKLISNFLS